MFVREEDHVIGYEGKTDSCRNSREELMTVEKPVCQGSKYLVSCLSFHSAHHNPLTSLEILDDVSDCLSFLRWKHSGFFILVTHTLKPQQSHLHTCSLCISRTLRCVGGVGWMLSGIEVHNKLQFILQRTSRSKKQREKEGQSRKWVLRCPRNNPASQLPCSSDHSNVYSEGNGNLAW